MGDKKWCGELELLAALCVGVFFGVIITISGYEIFSPEGWLNSWQTLISGVLAVISGVLIFYAAVYNEKQKVKKEILESQVCLVFSLVGIADYLKACMAICNSAYTNPYNLNMSSASYVNPDFQEKWLNDIRVLIRTADKKTSKTMSVFVAELQILMSRISGYSSKLSRNRSLNVRADGVDNSMYKIAFVHSILNRLFEFSRNGYSYDFSDFSFSEFKNSFSNMNVDLRDPAYSSLSDMVSLRLERGVNPIVMSY